MQDALNLLKTRRSVKPVELAGPGLTAAEIDTLLTVASRVPDHGKLVPWRFIVFEGEAAARGRRGDRRRHSAPNIPTPSPSRSTTSASAWRARRWWSRS